MFVSAYAIFFHLDYTIGPGVAPGPPHNAGRGLYRRSGITPCPEDKPLFNFDNVIVNEIPHGVNLFAAGFDQIVQFPYFMGTQRPVFASIQPI